MRSSGILLPISSLAGNYGIGTIGKEAFKFIDFLKDSAQKYWQILPVGPTSYGDSPYQSFSAFALNPYFIDLEELEKDGLLKHDEYANLNWGSSELSVDYSALYKNRFKVLELAAERLDENDGGFKLYCASNAFWLEDYALFMALKYENDGAAFKYWNKQLRQRNKAVLDKKRDELKAQLHFWRAVQYLFFKQWTKLKKYAGDNGVKIIGDIPIYVAADSADLWANPELFKLNDEGEPSAVAGCPPDYFSPDGQLWGNPLYDWEYHKKTAYAWWIRRVRYAMSLFDTVRIDHFRGFAGYYSIPAKDKTARNGQWLPGPSSDFVNAVKAAVPEANIIAEDLGFLTEDVRQMLKDSGFPGMKVLQFAFTGDPGNDYLPHNFIKNSVCYTGTHDNPTTVGFLSGSDENTLGFAKKYLGVKSDEELPLAFIRAAEASVADTCIIPLQDWLMLDNKARINTPSTLGGNWEWRLKNDALSADLSQKIREMTQLYAR